MEHPTEDILLRFILCVATRQENQWVVRHLLTSCSSCAATLRKLRKEPPQDPPLAPDAYDQALDRLTARVRAAGEAGRPLPSASSANATPRRRFG